MSAWKLLGTAPMDEPVLLAWKFGIAISIAHKSEDGNWYSPEGTNYRDGSARFTHWMPLPAPPTMTAPGERKE